MAPLEPVFGIRIAAVAPGVVKTPLFLDRPEDVWVDEEKDEWVTPEEVALAMVRLVRDEATCGGKILEVGKDSIRWVEALNDPGPGGEGMTTSHARSIAAEIIERLKVNK